MRDQLRIGSPLSWIVAWVLAVAAPVSYLAGAGLWVILLAVPLFSLALWREERDEMHADASPLGEGPYSPPPGL